MLNSHPSVISPEWLVREACYIVRYMPPELNGSVPLRCDATLSFPSVDLSESMEWFANTHLSPALFWAVKNKAHLEWPKDLQTEVFDEWEGVKIRLGGRHKPGGKTTSLWLRIDYIPHE